MDNAVQLPDGSHAKMGCVRPVHIRFGAVPMWADKNPVLAENDCPDHDDLAQFCEPPKTQHYSNCTNASLAWGAQAIFKANGVDCPDLSMSFLYALNNGGRDQGAMCRDVIASWMAKGLPPASVVPESQIFTPRGGFSRAVLAAALQWQGFEVYQCMNWDDVRSALARRFIVYHGFSLGQAFFQAPEGKVPEFDGQEVNGHAQCSRGLTRRFGDLRTITPNTWGSQGFGDNGIGYIPESYFAPTLGGDPNLDAYAIRSAEMPKAPDIQA
jgi:hypothetical protein